MARSTITPEHSSAQEKSFKSRSFKSRHLKVRKGFYDHQSTKATFGSHKVKEPVPWIYLKGYWLKQVGFEIGKTLQVSVQKDCLILKITDD